MLDTTAVVAGSHGRFNKIPNLSGAEAAASRDGIIMRSTRVGTCTTQMDLDSGLAHPCPQTKGLIRKNA